MTVKIPAKVYYVGDIVIVDPINIMHGGFPVMVTANKGLLSGSLALNTKIYVCPTYIVWDVSTGVNIGG